MKVGDGEATRRRALDPHEEPNVAVVVYFPDAYDGPGWYYYAEEYPEEGCVGRYDSRDACAIAAAMVYGALRDERGERIPLPVPATRAELEELYQAVNAQAAELAELRRHVESLAAGG